MKKEKFDFGLVKTDIGSWTNDNGKDLFELEVLKSETVASIGIYPGVKYKSSMKYLETNALFQSGGCGPHTTSGSTTLTHKDVEVKPYKVYETLCVEDLNDTSLQLSMVPGFNETLPFEAQWIDSKIKKQAKNLENKLWSNASGATEFSGFFEQFDTDSDVIDVTADFTATGLTSSELIALYNKVIDDIPEEVVGMEDLTMYLGHDAFRALSKAFLSLNNVQLTKFDFNGVDAFEFPGSEYVKIRPVNGLNAANNSDKRIVITPASNLLYVCDMQSEDENVKVWYSEDDDILKYLAKWKSGVAYKFGEYIVVSKKS